MTKATTQPLANELTAAAPRAAGRVLESAPSTVGAPPLSLAAPPAEPCASASAEETWPRPAGWDGEALLARGLAGLFESGSELATAAERVVHALSPLERAVLGGEEQALDPAAVRRAATMRLRLAEAIATAPGRPDAVDEGSLSALLAEAEAVLGEIGGLAAGAPGAEQRSLEAIREDLVRDAIRVSEAASAAKDAGASAAPAEAPAARREAPRTRVLSLSTAAPDADESASTVPRGKLVVLLLVIAAAAAFHFHGYRARHAERGPPPPTIPGAPAGALALPAGDGSFVVQSATAKFGPGELDALRAAQSAQGNTVEELGPGAALVRSTPTAASGR